MASISFKSVGKTASQVIDETIDQSPLPIGIVTPLRLGQNSEGIFAMHYNMADQVHDNLRNLLLTNWGERLGLYTFGANLKQLTTEFTTLDNFDAEAVVRIKAAVTTWMPYVNLIDYIPKTEHVGNSKTGVISFSITYDVPLIDVRNKSLELTLWVL